MGSQKNQGGSPRSVDEDYDPLFDDPELDAPGDLDQGTGVGGRGASSASAWRSAVPTLEPEAYERYSHNILMTAAIDGQITIWDRRVAGTTPGSGVGKLEIPEKTPPWCVSVRSHLAPRVDISFNLMLNWGWGERRHAGPQMGPNSMLADVTVPSRCGICAKHGTRMKEPLDCSGHSAIPLVRAQYLV